MKKKILLYFNTIKYLKPEQILFQVWYKIKPKIPWKESYTRHQHKTIKRLDFSEFALIFSTGKYKGNNTFSFLNRTNQFGATINWNFDSEGKLWNYNLQYFDYVFDSKHSDAAFTEMLEHCALSINNGYLKLEPYPVSLRLINWLLFYSKTGFSSPAFHYSIKIQIAFLEKNQEYHLLANHLLENKIALAVASIYLDDKKLLNTSLNDLDRQLEEQILSDGAHFECSPMYHCILLSRLLILVTLLKANGIETILDRVLIHTISRMVGWLDLFSFRNGLYALFNDATNEIALSKQVLVDAAIKNEIFPATKKLGPSGFRKMNGDRFELVIDVGNITPAYQPGHAHSDMLSFCLNVDNKPILIDPGISTYQPGSRRQLERSTCFHSTVSVAGENQSQVWSAFRVAKRAELKIIDDLDTYLRAEHNGYLSPLGLIHQRSFQLKPKGIVIEDRITKKTKNGRIIETAAAYFYFDTNVSVVIDKEVAIIDDDIILSFDGFEKISLDTYDQPIGYNLLTSSKMLKVDFITALDTFIILQS